MKITENEIKNRFRGQGRPLEYDFESLEVGAMKFIPCKKSNRDVKLASIRSKVSTIKRLTGKQFKASATETGVEVVRIS